ncbi:MAG: radical SAM protein [Bacteroidales bacterium]
MLHGYGGEPLLKLDVIERLTQRFIEICSNNNVEYKASLVTNGFLLNEEKINTLMRCKILNCQITLDGPPAVHDFRRCLKDGGGTFDTIMQNIFLILQTSIKLVIRLNLDKENMNYIWDLLQLIGASGIIKKGAYIYVAGIHAKTDSCIKIYPQCITNQDYALAEKIQLFLKNNGLVLSHPIKKYGGLCIGNRINAFVVSPKGDLFKCPECLGNQNEIPVGSIFSKDLIMTLEFIRWGSDDFFEDDKCLNCKYLPLCMGGSPYLRLGRSRTPIRNCVVKEDIIFKLRMYLREIYNV